MLDQPFDEERYKKGESQQRSSPLARPSQKKARRPLLARQKQKKASHFPLAQPSQRKRNRFLSVRLNLQKHQSPLLWVAQK